MVRFIILLFFFFNHQAWADSEFILSPIIKSSLPGNLLQEDDVVPAQSGKTSSNSGAGTIQNSLQNQLGLSVTDYGQPGAGGQIRGLGASAEDVDVQALGVSLNPSQGGGFDLGQFPQFLWSGYQYQTGPSLGAMNQSASAGTLKLTPWTFEALQDSGFGGRAIGFGSSQGVSQISAAAKYGGRVAVVAGYSDIKVKGPSAGLSARWDSGQAKIYQGSVHFLVSDLDAESPGSTDFQTPNARVRKTRYLPLLQNDFRVGSSGLLSNSIFFDQGYLSYSDPDSGFNSKIDSRQWGTQNVFLSGNWRFGLNFRQVYYASDFLTAPRQDIANLQVTYDLKTGPWLIQPTVQNIWVTDFGWVPLESLGIRRGLGEGNGTLFSRLSYSQRIPSLLDRYSATNEFGFSGNQNLKPETDWTATLGWELKGRSFETGVRAYGQLRKDARVLTSTTLVNFGDAHVLALSADSKYFFDSWLDLEQHLTYSNSKLYATGNSFPYLASWIGVLGLNVHTPGQKNRVEWLTSLRFNSGRTYSPATDAQLPGYLVLDTALQYRLGKFVSASARIENLFDRSIEIQKGYPLGRTISFQLFGEI